MFLCCCFFCLKKMSFGNLLDKVHVSEHFAAVLFVFEQLFYGIGIICIAINVYFFAKKYLFVVILGLFVFTLFCCDLKNIKMIR